MGFIRDAIKAGLSNRQDNNLTALNKLIEPLYKAAFIEAFLSEFCKLREGFKYGNEELSSVKIPANAQNKLDELYSNYGTSARDLQGIFEVDHLFAKYGYNTLKNIKEDVPALMKSIKDGCQPFYETFFDASEDYLRSKGKTNLAGNESYNKETDEHNKARLVESVNDLIDACFFEHYNEHISNELVESNSNKFNTEMIKEALLRVPLMIRRSDPVKYKDISVNPEELMMGSLSQQIV